MIDAQGKVLAQGRVDHSIPEDFHRLVERWPGSKVAFGASMNWHWLYEILETVMPEEDIVLANPFKTRIIAEAQIKTDKIDARVLADLLRANLISSVHVPAPDALLLGQQLTLLKELVAGTPGMGPILAAVVVAEIDDIARFPSAQKLCGYAGLCPSMSSSGGKTYHGRLLPHCNKWLRWAFVEAAWVAVGCSPYFGEIYKAKRAHRKKANTSILATARRMARITWALLTERRTYTNFPMTQNLRCQSRNAGAAFPSGLEKEGMNSSTPGKSRSSPNTFPSRSDC